MRKNIYTYLHIEFKMGLCWAFAQALSWKLPRKRSCHRRRALIVLLLVACWCFLLRIGFVLNGRGSMIYIQNIYIYYIIMYITLRLLFYGI